MTSLYGSDRQGLGASATPSGSRPAGQAPTGLDATRFDPSRGGRFRKRPLEVEAFQWINQDRNDWPEWAAEDDRLEDICAVLIGCSTVGLKVWSLEGAIRASHGDWIIRGIAGELYPCKPEIFSETYDAIATEAGTAETTKIGSVHEGAGPQDIAQSQPLGNPLDTGDGK